MTAHPTQPWPLLPPHHPSAPALLTKFLEVKGPRGTYSQRWMSRALQSFTSTYLRGREGHGKVRRRGWSGAATRTLLEAS